MHDGNDDAVELTPTGDTVRKLSDFRIVVSGELLADQIANLSHMIGDAFDRVLNPWKYPDRNPFPHIDPVPRYTATVARLAEYRHAAGEPARRLRAAIDVLRYGAPEHDEDEW